MCIYNITTCPQGDISALLTILACPARYTRAIYWCPPRVPEEYPSLLGSGEASDHSDERVCTRVQFRHQGRAQDTTGPGDENETWRECLYCGLVAGERGWPGQPIREVAQNELGEEEDEEEERACLIVNGGSGDHDHDAHEWDQNQVPRAYSSDLTTGSPSSSFSWTPLSSFTSGSLLSSPPREDGHLAQSSSQQSRSSSVSAVVTRPASPTIDAQAADIEKLFGKAAQRSSRRARLRHILEGALNVGRRMKLGKK